MLNDDPSQLMPELQALHADWALIRTLLGGTAAMRAAGRAYLPPWPQEDGDVYRARLASSTLLPAYGETIRNLAGRIFSQPLILGANVPEPLREQLNNVDLQGNNLQVWARQWFETAFFGFAPVLVDMPAWGGAPRSRADEKAAGLRPYAVIIHPLDVLGFRSSTVNGAQQLTQLRYREALVEADGEFGTRAVQQVRVLEPGSWRTYRRGEGGQWYLHDQGRTSLDFIPVVVFYTRRAGFFLGSPPLMEVAHLNVKHWQSQSDQDNLLHIARVPILATVGLQDEQPLSIGSSSVLKLPAGADARFVEHSGKAIEAGRQSIKDIIGEMHLAGARMVLREKVALRTVRQSEEDAAEQMSPLQMLAQEFEDALDQLLQLFARWQGIADGGNVEVRGNFYDDATPQVSLPLLLDMAVAGKLSDETLFAEMQRRGVISDERQWRDEYSRLLAASGDISSGIEG